MRTLAIIRKKGRKQEIEIRDLREKFFMVDDAYFNGHARKCGSAASLVYMILCRHVGLDQSCFPSITLISDKLGISQRGVMRAIRVLENWGIIIVKRAKGEKSVYYLTDKSKWKKSLNGGEEFRYRPKGYATRKERAGMVITEEGEDD